MAARMSSPVTYLDHAATTPMLPAAIEAMTAALGTHRQRVVAAHRGPARPGVEVEEARENGSPRPSARARPR